MNEKIKVISVLVSPAFLIAISAFSFIVGRVIFKRKYLDCLEIVRKHLRCFRKRNGKLSKVSIFLYFVVPCLIALSLVQIRILDASAINILTVIISILTSMFFTLLTLILDMKKRIVYDDKYNANDANLSSRILDETYYSIMFEILMSIIILLMCFIELFSAKYTFVDSIVIYYLTLVLILNLFIVLKRVYKVIDFDLNNS